jgi:hypothetical protein
MYVVVWQLKHIKYHNNCNDKENKIKINYQHQDRLISDFSQAIAKSEKLLNEPRSFWLLLSRKTAGVGKSNTP